MNKWKNTRPCTKSVRKSQGDIPKRLATPPENTVSYQSNNYVRWYDMRTARKPPGASIFLYEQHQPEGGVVRYMLDGTPNTCWHIMKGISTACYPHDIRLYPGDERMPKSILFQGTAVTDIRIKDYKADISMGGE